MRTLSDLGVGVGKLKIHLKNNFCFEGCIYAILIGYILL